MDSQWAFRFFSCKILPMDSAAAGTPGGEGTLGAARSFRDRVLARTSRGQDYTRFYYQFSSAAVQFRIFNPMHLARSHQIIERYKPVIQSMTNDEPVTLSRRDINELGAFLNSFAQKGSPE